MIRKLRNALLAFASASGVLAIALMSAAPTLPTPGSTPAGSMLAAQDARATTQAQASSPSQRRQGRRQQSVAMPYFSFGPALLIPRSAP